MTTKQQIFSIIISLAVFIFTIELVRKKRLREEYSLLWLGTSLMMIILIIRYDWLLALTKCIGAVLPTTTLFLGSIIFLMLLSVQYSIRISRLADQLKDLVQENALLRYEFEKIVKSRQAEVEEAVTDKSQQAADKGA
jgi:hypothetical protein